MIVLDENLFESQRVELLARRIHLRQVGYDVGRKGMHDDEIIALLQAMRRSTFFTRDKDFFKKSLCNDRFCLAYLDVRPLQAAQYVRRVLKHPAFKTWSQRRGCVARVASGGLWVWRLRAPRIARYGWMDRG